MVDGNVRSSESTQSEIFEILNFFGPLVRLNGLILEIKPAIDRAYGDFFVEPTKSKIGQRKTLSELCHFIRFFRKFSEVFYSKKVADFECCFRGRAILHAPHKCFELKK